MTDIQQDHLQYLGLAEDVEGVRRWAGYSCAICETVYPTKEQAAQCFLQGSLREHEIGDIVVDRRWDKYGRYAWFDGDPLWVAADKPNIGLHGRRGISFYYVVTAIDLPREHRRGDHSLIYHLRTLAMVNERGYGGGWTGKDHIRMVPAINPPEAVVRQGQELIGWRAKRLL